MKINVNINSENVDSNVSKILKGEKEFSSLNFNEVKSFNTAIEVLNKNAKFIRTLDLENPEHHKFVIEWLTLKTTSNYDFFRKIAFLKPEDYMSEKKHDNEILTLCLKHGLMQNRENQCSDLSVFYSFANELSMKLSYETKAGEEIVYNDPVLDLPTTLLVRANLALKIVDCYKFLKFIDVHIQQINPKIVYTNIINDFSLALRNAVLTTIDELKLCYYDLGKHYTTIINKALEKMTETFKNRGLEINNIFILNITIPNGVSDIIERKKLESIQIMEDVLVKTKAERLALENYEKKAEIHKKYPEWDVTLTEREKDNAVERYNIKEKLGQLHHIQETQKVKLAQRNVSIGEVKEIKQYKEPKTVELPKPNIDVEIIVIIIGILVSIIGLIISSGIKFMFIAFGILSIGLSIARIVKKYEKYNQSISTKANVNENNTNKEGK